MHGAHRATAAEQMTTWCSDTMSCARQAADLYGHGIDILLCLLSVELYASCMASDVAASRKLACLDRISSECAMHACCRKAIWHDS
jgi:hypothetical protein